MTNNRKITCIHLGLETDRKSCFAFPSDENFCHAKKSPFAVKFAHQENFCLLNSHLDCPVFNNPETSNLTEIKSRITHKKSRPVWVPYLIGGVLIVIFGSFLLFQNRNAENIALSEISESPDTNSAITSSSSTPTRQENVNQATPTLSFSTETSTSQPTPSEPSATPQPTIGPGLLTPFGPEGRYILHEVQSGESLTLLAARYQSTRDVLLESNVFIQGVSLLVGQMLVVLPGVTETQDLPKFEIIQLEVSMDINKLSENYGVTVNNLRWYNSLGLDDRIPAKRWLIIPITQ